MYKLNVLLLIAFVLLTGCSRQETIRATGEGEHWKAHLIYEVTDSDLYKKGGIEYTGDEELLYVTYSLVTDEGRRGGEVKPQENQTAIDFGLSSGNNPPAIDAAIISLNHAYVEIKWQTKTGEYEEKVELSVE